MVDNIRKNIGWVILVLFIFAGCGKKSEYDQVVARELAKGVKQDSLFLGFQLGMTTKEFYARAWELNKKHKLINSSSNMAVVYRMDSLLKAPAKMSFYPKFYKNRIYLMPVRIAYDDWAPWNQRFSADTLEQDVLHLFRKWYGPGFFKVNGPHGEVAYVKVDANRRITILKHNEHIVDVLFTDIIAERERNRAQKAESGIWDKVRNWF